MFLRGIFIIWLLVIEMYCVKVSCFHVQKKICAKEKYVDHKKSFIESDTTNFKHFVCRSNLFVDKSLLVKTILEAEPLISLTYPRKWGKSINLDMLKQFLDIEFDYEGIPTPVNNTWSYMFFKHGVIRDDDDRIEKLTDAPMIAAHEDIIQQYLAQYPVIHIDLSIPEHIVCDFTSYLNAFRNKIITVFKKYDFIVEKIRDQMDDLYEKKSDEKTKMKEQLKKFTAYRQGTVNKQEELVKSVSFLSTLLHRHFHRRVFVLIDNYDTPIRLGYLDQPEEIVAEEARKFMNFFVDFMTTTFMSNENIMKGVLTGLLSLDLCSFPLLGLNHPVNYNAIKNNMYPFHGFTSTEVSQLLKQAGYPKITENILNRYNGYHMLNFPDVVIYNPRSIVDVVQRGQIDDDWCRSICLEKPYILPNLFRHENIHGIFQALITRSVDAKMKRRDITLHRDDIVLLHLLISSEEPMALTDAELTLILVFHFATGYITLDFNSPFTNWNNELSIKIPCMGVERIIVKGLMEHYKSILGNAIVTKAEVFAKMLVEYIDGSKPEREPIEKLYNKLSGNSSFDVEKQKLFNSAHFFALLHLRLSSDFVYNVDLNSTYYDDSEKKLTPHMLVYGKGKGLIYGLDYSISVTQESDDEMNREYRKLEKAHQSYFKKKPVELLKVCYVRYYYRIPLAHIVYTVV